MAKILLVDDDTNARRVMSLSLEAKGHIVTPCVGVDDAKTALHDDVFDIVLTDLRMQGHDAGLDVVKMSVALQPDARVLLITAYASAETAVSAMRMGAFDYVTKPVSGQELADAVERALAEHEETLPNKETPSNIAHIGELIGSSAVMQRVRDRLKRAANRDFTVLISGESGTGKELAARFVHRRSTRAQAAFVPVHCGAIPDELFESELFGHCRGAFTGADSDRLGLIETASGGTLFLDEVGEMPLAVQVKLLRVLQDHQVRRVGEEKERDVNVRIVAATHRDLAEEVREGRFREDLFYRLNVIPIYMPPLRQRQEDVPELLEHLLNHWSRSGECFHISPACVARISRLPLAGNVRELENLLQRMIALSDGLNLDVSLLEGLLDGLPAAAPDVVSLAQLSEKNMDMDQWLHQAELRLIREALQVSGENITKAAKVLGLSFRSLRYRLGKLGVRDEQEGGGRK